MLAISVMIGTMYACHVDKKEDQICHISFASDQICLPSFVMGTRYARHIFKIENSFPAKQVHFRSNLIGPYDLPFYCASFPSIGFDRK